MKFYAALDELAAKCGGALKLAECSGRMNWPRRGVYFFCEDGEHRTDSGSGPRVVRIGTHALKAGSSTMLWTRLSQHKGRQSSGGGNHRGSISNPGEAPPDQGHLYARPDDPSDAGVSWRELLLRYNQDPQDNPLALTPAWQLYEHPVYRRLVEQFGAENVYILSAGWGLISADFLTSDYDITFTAAVRKKAPHKFRRKTDRYADLCLLPHGADDPVLFFGGKDYVPLFCRLTSGMNGARTIFYNSDKLPDAPGCNLVRYNTTTRTNWHYECAGAVLDGRVVI